MILRIYKGRNKKLEEPDVICVNHKFPAISNNSDNPQVPGKPGIHVAKIPFRPCPDRRDSIKHIEKRIYGRGPITPIGYHIDSSYACSDEFKELEPSIKKEHPYCPKFKKGRCGKDILINPPKR